jgi:lipoic acid synthetase
MGRPLTLCKSGKLIAGMPHKVHKVQKDGSPVLASPLGAALKTVVESGIEILNHNIETVPRLYGKVRPGHTYECSLNILKEAKKLRGGMLTKSGFMVGVGETAEEIMTTLRDLRNNDVDIVTIGQYLQPSDRQLKVERYVTPEEFQQFKVAADQLGFRHVESGPLVRSSYHAWSHVG